MEPLLAISRCLGSHLVSQYGGRFGIAGARRLVRGCAPVRMEAHRHSRSTKVALLKVVPFPTTLESPTTLHIVAALLYWGLCPGRRLLHNRRVLGNVDRFDCREVAMENVNRSLSFGQSRPDVFNEIIGDSAALKSVLAEVKLVAPTDSTALILGETGTGKELIARAIHNISPRRGRPFIKLNCAAIPFDLLESELFGHEKGAFTGAVAQKIGRFEMADGGTLFLDEIGDIPLALQSKLLRVLQEQEFERLGSGRTHRINVRLVAATHRDLDEMVRRNEFRSDLFYRLNVFPVVLPPLRERREDISQLVAHFVGVYTKRMNKRITHIPSEIMDAFKAYPWPGNIRELQNLIERAVILSDDGVLPNTLPTLESVTVNFIPASSTLVDSQRALILKALQTAEWLIGGPHGAATRLGLKRTTLIAKMKKLGISRPAPRNEMNALVGTRGGEQWMAVGN
jgi:formate hydrogenlyase transcriptional activator